MVFLHPYDSSMKEKTSVTLSPQMFERKRPPSRSKTCTIRLHRRYPASMLTGAAALAQPGARYRTSQSRRVKVNRDAEAWSGTSGSRPGVGGVFTTMKRRVDEALNVALALDQERHKSQGNALQGKNRREELSQPEVPRAFRRTRTPSMRCKPRPERRVRGLSLA